MEDTPNIAKRRLREQRTVSQMIALYCSGNHDASLQTEQAFCGEPLCPECAALDAYTYRKTERCRTMGTKTSCDECENHCYKPEMREQIRRTMRYSGPRMLTKHPIAAIRHLIKK